VSETVIKVGRAVQEMKKKGLLPPLDELDEIVKATNTDDPDPADVAKLRRILKEYPELWRVAGDLVRYAVSNLAGAASGGVSFTAESMIQAVEVIHQNLGYNNAPEIERLLIEQVGLCWLRLSVLELNYTQVFSEGAMTIPQAGFWEKRLNFTQRRFLRAVETLARVRKVTCQTLALQVNIAGQQVNVMGDVRRETKE
jgi:hypothetical protein